jgi:hypothetical protein
VTRDSAGVFTRSAGTRLAIVGASRLQAHELDEGLALGHKAIDTLTTVQSQRAKGYVRDFLHELTSWQQEPQARAFAHRAHEFLAA